MEGTDNKKKRKSEIRSRKLRLDLPFILFDLLVVTRPSPCQKSVLHAVHLLHVCQSLVLVLRRIKNQDDLYRSRPSIR